MLNALPAEPPKAITSYRSQIEKQQQQLLLQQQQQSNANNANGQKKPNENGNGGGAESKTPNKRERALSTSSEIPGTELRLPFSYCLFVCFVLFCFFVLLFVVSIRSWRLLFLCVFFFFSVIPILLLTQQRMSLTGPLRAPCLWTC
jgi:hypothetical protein